MCLTIPILDGIRYFTHLCISTNFVNHFWFLVDSSVSSANPNVAAAQSYDTLNLPDDVPLMPI